MKKYFIVASIFSSLSVAGTTPETIRACDSYWSPKIAEAKAAHERANQRLNERPNDHNRNDIGDAAAKLCNLCCKLESALNYCFKHGLAASKLKYENLIE